jgi:DNA mismatch endonuclease (patch repair protein)
MPSRRSDRPPASDAATAFRMSRVRRSGTRAEKLVVRALRAAGHCYRRNVRKLPGSPDFANRTRRWVVFVNGCFWHHHKGCRRGSVPKTNENFWREKFAANRRRDARAVRELRRRGFKVLLVWECEAADLATRLNCVQPFGDQPKSVSSSGSTTGSTTVSGAASAHSNTGLFLSS